MQVATQSSLISANNTNNTSSSTVSSVQAQPLSAATAAAALAAAGINQLSINQQSVADPMMAQLLLDHPLYPLLQMVFQKCELATSSPRDAQAETICSSDSFSEDIRNFIHESRLRNVTLTTGVQDVDRFMLKSIEVLRLHLLELEKVHQLCDNFCTRYINALKGKLPIDLVVDDGSSRDTNSASRNGNGNQQDGSASNSNANANGNAHNGQSNNQPDGHHNSQGNNQTTNHHHNHNHHQQHQSQSQSQSLGASQLQQPTQLQQELANGYPPADYHAPYAQSGYGAAGYGASAVERMNPYAAHHAAYASAAAAAAGLHSAAGAHYSAGEAHLAHSGALNSKHEVHSSSQANNNNNNNNNNHHHQNNHRELTASSGSSSASSIKLELSGANGQAAYGSEANSATSTAPDRQQLHDDVRSPTGSTGSFLGDASLGSGDGTECEDEDNRGRRQQKKRGIFPKTATNIMRAWLFQHLNHPYPSEDQKKSLAEDTGLTILQVNNWFINARRRIVQPMIDQSNRTSGNIMAGPAYSPDAGMGYMLDSSQPFRSLPGVDSSGMGPLASHAAMTSAMGAYSAASAQHLSHYGRSQQQHAAMLGLSTPPTGPHMMGAHPTLPPHEYYP